MDQSTKNQIECFNKEYNKLYSEGPEKWNKEKLDAMKNLQKIMYYIAVRCAMEEGKEYPGSEHMPEMSYMRRSYTRGRDPMTGQFVSYASDNGRYYPPHMDGMDGMSSRRYYDSKKQMALEKLHRMMANEDGEKKDALNMAIIALEGSD